MEKCKVNHEKKMFLKIQLLLENLKTTTRLPAFNFLLFLVSGSQIYKESLFFLYNDFLFLIILIDLSPCSFIAR